MRLSWLAQPGHPPERALVFFPTLQPAKGEWPGCATTCEIVTRTGPVRRFDYRLTIIEVAVVSGFTTSR